VLLQKPISNETELQSLKWDPNLENMTIYVDIGTSLIAFTVIAGMNVLIRRQSCSCLLGPKNMKCFYKED